MDTFKALSERKKALIERISAFSEMRRGSISEQFVQTKDKDGASRKRGPYLIYSFKDKGQKTVSRYLPDKATAKRYREQIDQFRRFEAWRDEFVEICHTICDLKEEARIDPEEASLKKKRRKPSSTRSSGRSRD